MKHMCTQGARWSGWGMELTCRALYLSGLIALALLGCRERSPRVWTPPPRPTPAPYDMGGAETLDMTPGGGSAGGEAGVMGGEAGAETGGGGSAGGDDRPWLRPTPAPSATQVAMITSAERLWLVWLHGDELRLSVHATSALEALEEEALSLQELSQSTPLLEALKERLPEGQSFTPDELTLQGIYAGRPWLILSHPLLPSALLIDLSAPESSPIETGLKGPLTMATHGELLWLIGALPTVDQTEVIAWRWWGGESLGVLHSDTRGLSAPVSATYALGNWTLLTREGQCLTASRRSPESQGVSWRCESLSGSRAWGDPDQLTIIGPSSRATEDNRPALWSWVGLPGHAVDPLNTLDDSPLTYLSTREGFTWHGEGILWSTDSDERLAWTARRRPPPRLIDELVGGETGAPSGGDTGGDTGGATAGSSGGAGAEVGAEAGAEAGVPEEQLDVGERLTLQASLSPYRPVISLADLGDRPIILSWDVDTGTPELTLGGHWRVAQPLASLELSECLIEPERCDELDHDCDGAERNGLCCQDGELSAALLGGVVSADRGWLTAESELGLMVGVASSGRADLFTAPFTGGDAQLRATWPGVQSLELIGNLYSLVALVGRDPDGQPVVLWNLSQGEGRYAQLPAPCEPLALSVIDQTFKTRLICAEAIYELDPEEGSITQVSPPEAGERLWVQRWHPQGLLSDQVYYVVAIGETAQLSLWREGREEGLSLASELSLPNALGFMSPSDRLEPFTPPTVEGGWPARVFDRGLEVWSPQAGWVSALGSRWPLTASVSAFSPLAVSVGYTEDPALVGDSFLQRVTLFTHHLGPNADFWGSPYKSSVSKDSFAGAHPAGYSDLGGARPNMMTLIGSGLELGNLSCQ